MTIAIMADQYLPPQVDSIRRLINAILDDYMEPLVNATIIAEMRALSDAAGLPPAFKDSIRFVKTAPNEGDIINEWGDEKKPLARWFNYGTRRHWIEPVRAKVLAWKHKAGIHAQAIFFQGRAKKGDWLFSTGHYVSGVPRTEVMERGLERGMKYLEIEAARIVRAETQ